jgi:hypothetical protein
MEWTINMMGRCLAMLELTNCPLSYVRSAGAFPTSPIRKFSISEAESSRQHFRSYKRSLAKSRIDILFLPLPGRKLALYPNVRMRASLMSGSEGRNFRGQKKSGSRSWDHVVRLLPPKPCTKTRSTLRSPVGRYTTCRPRGSCQEESDPLTDESVCRPRFDVLVRVAGV